MSMDGVETFKLADGPRSPALHSNIDEHQAEAETKPTMLRFRSTFSGHLKKHQDVDVAIVAGFGFCILSLKRKVTVRLSAGSPTGSPYTYPHQDKTHFFSASSAAYYQTTRLLPSSRREARKVRLYCMPSPGRRISLQLILSGTR